MAHTHLNEAIKLADHIMQNWVLLALLEQKMGRQDNCLQICEKIISMDPNNERVYEFKGDLFQKNFQIEEAFIEYSKAVQINPESSSAISSLGNVLKFKGKLTEALAHYKRALKLNVNQPNTLMELMNTKLACCDWENYDEYFQHLVNVVTAQVQRGELPCADPFNIFMMNFTSEQKFEIARLYSEHIKQRTLQGLQAIGEPVPQFSF